MSSYSPSTDFTKAVWEVVKDLPQKQLNEMIGSLDLYDQDEGGYESTRDLNDRWINLKKSEERQRMHKGMGEITRANARTNRDKNTDEIVRYLKKFGKAKAFQDKFAGDFPGEASLMM